MGLYEEIMHYKNNNYYMEREEIVEVKNKNFVKLYLTFQESTDEKTKIILHSAKTLSKNNLIREHEVEKTLNEYLIVVQKLQPSHKLDKSDKELETRFAKMNIEISKVAN